jgi:hypothetical protein
VATFRQRQATGGSSQRNGDSQRATGEVPPAPPLDVPPQHKGARGRFVLRPEYDPILDMRPGMDIMRELAETRERIGTRQELVEV